MKRRRCNKIMGLENAQGVWCTKPSQVDAIAVSYFQSLFLTCNPIRVPEITECVKDRISVEDTRGLMQPVTEEEVHHTIFQIPADKSSGPDRFTGRLYHQYWDVVGKDIVKMVQAFWFSAFMAGRQIHNNVLVVHEVLHYLSHQRDRNEASMAMKLDIAKAYDRVEWRFLLAMMKALGFP
ncbi:hypothetical protein PS2_018566 [Malus domestica]